MDRRQRKTREAVFNAFIELLSKKSFNNITVGEIIEKADIGRATFYAHFETKDFLLKELCRELFCHVFDSVNEEDNGHKHIFECNAPDSVFLHLFMHFQKNDNHILDLLSCNNNDLFLSYFNYELKKLIKENMPVFENINADILPDDFILEHISATFVSTLKWWVGNKMKESPEIICHYFFTVLGVNG